MDWHDIGFEKVYDHPVLIDGFVLCPMNHLYDKTCHMLTYLGMYMETLIIRCFSMWLLCMWRTEITGRLNCMDAICSLIKKCKGAI